MTFKNVVSKKVTFCCRMLPKSRQETWSDEGLCRWGPFQRWKLRKSTKNKWKQDKESNWWIRLEKIWKDKTAAAAAAKLPQSCLTLCDPIDGSVPSMGFSRQEYWSGVPIEINHWNYSISLSKTEGAQYR